jgi:hypothetical protein
MPGIRVLLTATPLLPRTPGTAGAPWSGTISSTVRPYVHRPRVVTWSAKVTSVDAGAFLIDYTMVAKECRRLHVEEQRAVWFAG